MYLPSQPFDPQIDFHKIRILYPKSIWHMTVLEIKKKNINMF